MIGTSDANSIMASGLNPASTGRTHDSTPKREIADHTRITLAIKVPSTHDSFGCLMPVTSKGADDDSVGWVEQRSGLRKLHSMTDPRVTQHLCFTARLLGYGRTAFVYIKLFITRPNPTYGATGLRG